ncbi:MAG TPA: response regulator [Polyangia bacterium]|nr:response regulator [Polyangia bacterium]
MLPPTPATVLVIEDDHDVRVAVRSALEDEGYRVLSVTDGRCALEILERGAELPDLILLDLMLPVMDGWEFAARIRSVARWSRIPVAVMSAFDRAPPPGIVTFLRKPVKRDALVQLTERYCRR